MAGINLGNDFNAELVALVGWSPTAVDPTTIEVPFLNPGGPTTVRAVAQSNVDTDALNALIQKYAPVATPTEPVTDPTD